MVFTFKYNGHWLGAYGVVVADTQAEARQLVEAAAIADGNDGPAALLKIELEPFHVRTKGATILFNGNY